MRYLLFAVLSLLLTSPAYACSCRPQTRAQALDNADLVVQGTVEHSTGGGKHSDGPVTARVHVEQWIKGTSDETITVVTAGNSAACGIDLPQGKTMELLLRKTETSDYRASLCGQLWTGKNAH